jgi:hypothetical protein
MLNEKEIEDLFTYHAPTEESREKYIVLRREAKNFARILNETVPDCADKSAAIRKLRECVMTANAAIALNQKEDAQEEFIKDLSN